MRGRYIGPDLAALFDDAPAKRAMRDITDRAGDELHDLAVRNTPILTGNLRSAWYREHTHVEATLSPVNTYVSRVANDTSYAAFVNYGTGLYGPEHHWIYPKTAKALSWVDPISGRRVFARRVRGIKPQYMIESAAAKLEATLPIVVEPELLKFKEEQEALMRIVARVVY